MPASTELTRQYRVARQLASMHAVLHDRYRARSRRSEVVLLVSSVLIACMSFASEAMLADVGISPQTGRRCVALLSVAALVASLCLLVLDWSGSAVRHALARDAWSDLSIRFRILRTGRRTWQPDHANELATRYGEVSKTTVGVPEAQFIALKRRHLQKVELSKFSDENPWCPHLVLRLVLAVRGVRKLLTKN